MTALLRLFALSAALFAALPMRAQEADKKPAEEEADPGDPLVDIDASGQLMDSGDYEGALKLLLKVDLKKLTIDYGNVAGIVPFRKGYCLKMLGKLDEALKEYDLCIGKYKNTPEMTAEQKNPVWEISQMEKASVLQMLGKYDDALTQYQAFLKLGYKENYEPTALQIQIAVCYAKINKLEESRAILEKLFTAENLATMNNVLAMQGYVSLIESWANSGKASPEKMPAIEKDALQFIDKYGTYLNVSPWELSSSGQNLRLLGAAKICVEAEMLPLALRLYGMVGTTSDVIQDLNTRASAYPQPPQKLVEEIKKYEALLADPENPDISSLIGVANIYERLKATRPALGVYEYLFNKYPKSKYAPDFLYGAARTARFSNQMEISEFWATKFLNAYPEHEYATDVSALLLDRLFRDGKYQRALETALRIREKMPQKSKQRDMPDFVVACSLHYLGKYAEAKSELEAHLKNYPKSRFRETVMYSDAANYTRLAEYGEAKKRLTAFIAEFPKSPLKPYARFDFGDACYQEGKFAEGIASLQKIYEESPQFAEMDRAKNLEGDCYYQLKELGKSAEAYTAALALATKGGQDRKEIAGKALAQILFIARDESRNADVVKFYDQYEQDYKGLSTEAQVIAASLDAIRDVGGKEAEVVALQRLEQVIITLASAGGSDVSLALEQAFGTYSKRYAEDIGPLELEARLKAFPIPAGVTVSPEVYSWITITLIDLYSDKSYEKQFPNAGNQIKVSFDDLDKDAKPADMPGYILLKLANNFRDRGGPFLVKADEYYTELVKRGPAPPNNEYYPKALLGRGIMNARSDNPQRRKEGIQQLKDVTKDDVVKEDSALVEQALLEAGFAETAAGSVKPAIEILRPIWDDKTKRSRRDELAYALFDLYDKAGETKNALLMGANFMIPPLDAEVTAIEVRYRSAQLQVKAGEKEKAFIIVLDTLQRMWVNFGKEGDPKKLLPKFREMYVQFRDELGKPRDAALESKIGVN